MLTITTRVMRRSAIAGLAAGILILVTTAGCSFRSHRPTTSVDAWQVRGAVVALDSSAIEVRHKTGRVVTFVIDDATVFVSERAPSAREALRVGRRVLVQGQPESAHIRAVRIQIF